MSSLRWSVSTTIFRPHGDMYVFCYYYYAASQIYSVSVSGLLYRSSLVFFLFVCPETRTDQQNEHAL